MSLIGIDFGNQNICASQIKNGIVQVILNKASKRTIQNKMSLKKDSDWIRIYDTDVQVRHFKHLEQNIIRRFIVDEADQKYGIEQVASFMLDYVFSLGNYSECVLAIPYFFDEIMIQKMVDAVKISKKSACRFIRQNTAAAIDYGMYKGFKSEFSEEGETVMFINIGHSTFEISKVQFNNTGMKTLLYEGLMVGGLDLDTCLFDYFATEFQDKHGCDVRLDKKSSLKLMSACEKIKKSLSVNKKCVHQVEYLMNEIDFTLRIDRVQFEQLISQTICQMRDLLIDSMNGIDRVEVLGGSSRVPCIHNMIETCVKEWSVTILVYLTH